MAEELNFNVKTNIEDAAKDAKKLGDNIEGAAKKTDKLEGATKKGEGGFKKLSTAVKGFGLALKAAGIGLVIAAFVALKEAIGKNQRVMDGVNAIMGTISLTFNQVVEVLIDVYDWVTDSTEKFDSLGKVIKGLITIQLAPLKMAFLAIKMGVQGAMLAWEDSFLGGKDPEKIKKLQADIKETANQMGTVAVAAFNAGKDIATNIGGAFTEVVDIYGETRKRMTKIDVKANHETSKAQIEARNNAIIAAAAQQGIVEQKDREAALQRKIRDDVRITFAERIEANKKLNTVLDEQEEAMLKNADLMIKAAKMERDANKGSVELQAAYITALNERKAVLATIEGFREEQLMNEAGLELELAALKKQLFEAGLEGQELELVALKNAYDEKVEMARLAGEDITAITEKYKSDEAAINKKYSKEELKFSEMTQEQQLGIMSKTAGDLATILGEESAAGKAAAIAQATIQTYLGATKAFSSMSSIPVVGPALGAIAAAAAVAAGIANVKAIIATGDGGGSVPAAPSGGGGGGATPSTTVASGAFTLGEGEAPEPVQAFVVPDDMTNNQNKLANIRRRATI